MIWVYVRNTVLTDAMTNHFVWVLLLLKVYGTEGVHIALMGDKKRHFADSLVLHRGYIKFSYGRPFNANRPIK